MPAARFAALSLLLLLSSCESPIPQLELHGQTGAVADDLASGAVVSSRLANVGGGPARVLSVSPVADPGLRVDYLGLCDSVCPGSLDWDDPETQEILSENDGGVGPFVVPADDAVTLMLRLRIPDPSRAKDCPKLHGVALNLVGGGLVVAGLPTEGPVASLEGPVPLDAPLRCGD